MVKTNCLITPNKKQQECIDNINGKYLVLAGPGTGKTFTVAYRIKNMIEKGIAPKKILCLTFTDTAAVEMKNKIISAFKGIDKGVNVFTYHGFCNSIINEYPEEFGLPKGCKKVPDAISRRFLKECIDSCDVKYFRNNKNNPYNFVNIIFSSIGEIKKNRLAKHQFFENLKTNPEWYPALEDAQNVIELKLKEHKKILKKDEKEVENLTNKIERANELWMLYECYQEKMEKSGFFDYDDMLSLVLDKFESNPNFLEEIANQYEYILIDEYQDTNKLQYTIAKELAFALKSQNIFVVGDDDQIIYSFQGANLDTLENFLNEFENTKVICLQENMRSTQTILDLSRAIITQDARRLEINPKFSNFNISKELISKNKDMIALDHSVQLTKFHNPKQENIVIIDKIEKEIIPNLKENEKLSDIAILTTSNDDLKEYEKLLHDRNIPCELKEGRSIFEINSFVTLFSYLQMLSNPELYSDKILKLLLMPPFKVSALDFAKIITEISKNKTFIQTLKEEQNWIEKDKIDNFLNNYNYFLEFIPKENIRNIIMEIGSKTGIFQYFINSKINKEENILAISKMLEIANEFYDLDHKTTLEEFIEYILMLQEDKDIDLKIDKPPCERNAIQLSTYHGSKGKEYGYVFLPSLQKSKWEGRRASFKPTIPVSKEEYKPNEYWIEYATSDRLKTLYVGFTRAKHSLFLSYFGDDSLLSEWILKIKDKLKFEDLSEYDEKKHTDTLIQTLEKRDYDYKRDFSSFIDASIPKQFSASSLNTYLKCPRSYFYEKILKLSCRQGFSDAANYGSAIHNTFKYLIKDNDKKRKEYPTLENTLEYFRKIFTTYPISTKEQRKIYEQRGINEITKSYHHICDIPLHRVFDAELKFGKNPNSIFYGVIDKIEKNDDDTYTIIDYKTSDPKDKTKITLDGEHKDYFHQLCLYKYCFEKETQKTVKNLVIYYPLNCIRYEIPKEMLEVDYKNAIENYKNAIEKIKNHEFEPVETSKRDVSCKYCAFKDFCNMNII